MRGCKRHIKRHIVFCMFGPLREYTVASSIHKTVADTKDSSE